MKTIQHPDGHAPRLLNPLTRRQREIYDGLAVPAPDCIGSLRETCRRCWKLLEKRT